MYFSLACAIARSPSAPSRRVIHAPSPDTASVGQQKVEDVLPSLLLAGDEETQALAA